MFDVLIIGKGPAGISASLYTSRAGLKTLVVGSGVGSLSIADKIENYYGFENPISGKDLTEIGLAQAERLGVKIITDEVLGISWNNNFIVTTKNANFEANAVIIATGSSRTKTKIEGITEYEGKGISYCAVCDAFFHRGKNVAVLGSGDYALHEALELLPIANSVTVLTNGNEPTAKFPDTIKLEKRNISKIIGDGNKLSGVEFSGGETSEFSGGFIALGVAGSADLAKKLGAQTDGNNIVVDENMATNLPGLFAAGDCTGGLLQISKAVYEGSKAATEAIKFLRKKVN